jgi:hypothetical protein
MCWHRADSFRTKATRPWVNLIEIESEPNIDPFGFQILGADCGSNAAPSHNKICKADCHPIRFRLGTCGRTWIDAANVFESPVITRREPTTHFYRY